VETEYVIEEKTVQIVHLIVVDVEIVEMDLAKILLEKIVVIALKTVEPALFHDAVMAIVIYTLMKAVQLALKTVVSVL
jgi:hypothetical protein